MFRIALLTKLFSESNLLLYCDYVDIPTLRISFSDTCYILHLLSAFYFCIEYRLIFLVWFCITISRTSVTRLRITSRSHTLDAFCRYLADSLARKPICNEILFLTFLPCVWTCHLSSSYSTGCLHFLTAGDFPLFFFYFIRISEMRGFSFTSFIITHSSNEPVFVQHDISVEINYGGLINKI